jgi:DNA-binding MarR family transcriptional regulator/predicted GNAT family acetyltransferase
MRVVAETVAPASIAAVRAFNRFYTRWVGALDEGLLRTRHSLPEARVLFELGRSERTEVAELRRMLDLDAGYLSRLLGGLEAGGLVERQRSAADGRRQVARLTKSGRAAVQVLDRRSGRQVGARLRSLRREDRDRLVAAMGTVQRLLEPAGPPAPALRAPEPGDYGWIVERHGALYAQEFGWDETFEAEVARIVGEFAARRDPDRERARIATLGGERVGSVLCVRRDDRVARLLLVEPRARGMGVGARLVAECVEFARRTGYRELTLWTNDVLVSARRIYEAAGFRLVDSEPHRSFGHDLVGQDWSLRL